MYSKFIKAFSISCALLPGAHFFVAAQANMPVFKDAVKEKRDQFYNNIIANINSSLALPLNDENEEAWISAFGDINLVKYHTGFVNTKIDHAAARLAGRSTEFKFAFLELVNSDYQNKYVSFVKPVFKNAGNNFTLLAMSANYLLPSATSADLRLMQEAVAQRIKIAPEDALLHELNVQIKKKIRKIPLPSVSAFFAGDYLPGQVLVLSFQRNDRNFPGLTIVRKADGSFVKNDDGTYFAVGQLARSESNMPGYITLGNTPQGIFRMDGFDTSKNFFIGPVTNIQLTLPFEFKASHFFRDSSIVDTDWNIDNYKKLLPRSFQNYSPLFGTWYAGKAGRNEIIAHGTTIDPAYYKSNTWYPYSPSAGCLVAKEFWNEGTGVLQTSDQLLLAEAVKTAGGAKGYLIVIETGDKRSAVTREEILTYIK